MKYTTESRIARFAVCIRDWVLVALKLRAGAATAGSGPYRLGSKRLWHLNCIERYLAFPILQTCYWFGSR
jgi:hypothetical protein